jgi:D-glycero-alpha-D-manno-heptose 1-phosphate guanylyltransferase
MVKEAVILAGGFGTRLRSVVKDIPKPMAEVCGKPFLSYLLDFLNKQKIERVILSVGYKFDIIKNFFGSRYKDLKLEYAIEDKPLGTGGGLKNALKYTSEKNIYVLNGDTFFDIDLIIFFNFHKNKNSKLTIALKKIENAERYGVVEIDHNNKIISFLEKGKMNSGFINGGIYLLNIEFFNSLAQEDSFSFEKNFLEKYYKKFEFYGFPLDRFFIDIGIPEDYERANIEFQRFKD